MHLCRFRRARMFAWIVGVSANFKLSGLKGGTNMFRKMAMTLIGIIVVIAAFVYVPRAWQGLQQTLNGLHVALPVYAPTQKTVWLDQNWTGDQRKWFYHADQGQLTFAIPYEWFVALERPISLPNIFAECGRLADPAYLDRFG